MNIANTQVDIDHSAFEIYVSGCQGHCAGCYNSELWDFNQGIRWKEYLDKYNVFNKIEKATELIDKIVILGGEPFDQNLWELLNFILYLKLKSDKEIWLFTSYENIGDHPVLKYLDYIKHGKYIKELETDNNIQFGYKLATSNQYIKDLRKV